MAFKPAQPAVDERLIANIHGRTKRGKSSVLLTFPRPIYIGDLDHQTRELLRIHPELAEDVHLAEYHIPENPSHEEASKLVDEILEDWQDACELAAKKGGTVALDTATQLWQVIQKVKVDEIANKRLKEEMRKWEAQDRRGPQPDPDMIRIFPYDYRQANALMTAVLQRPYIYPTLNAVYINRHRELYAGANPTGQWGFQGFANTEDLVQLNVEMKFDNDNAKKPNIVSVFGPNRFRSDLVGMEWTDKLTYDDLVAMFLKPKKKSAKK